MHICIPDTRELHPPSGSSFLLYNIHIDGLYHCSLRYKQLLHLHQALSKRFSSPNSASSGQALSFNIQLPPFPPKKLLPLSVSQIEDRRAALEKYLQNVSQDKAIRNSSIFNLFLLEAQRESTRIRQNPAELDVELVNGHKIRIQIMAHDSADTILTKTSRALGLSNQLNAYFCLCLCGYDVVKDKLIIKRRLSFFEAPYVTLHMAKQHQEQLQSALTSTLSHDYNNNASSRSNTSGYQNCQDPASSSSYDQQDAFLKSSTTTRVCDQRGDSRQRNYHPHYHHPQQYQHNNNHNLHYQNQSDHFNGSNNDNNNNNNNSTNHTTNNCNRVQQSSMLISSSNSIPVAPIVPVSATKFVRHRILFRKSYWDPTYDTYLLSDAQALNLLFIQTVYDIKHNFMFLDRETYHKLDNLLASDSKLEYILLARTLKHYNHVHFEPCYSDYPRPRTKVMISIGSKELNMRVLRSTATSRRVTSQSGIPQSARVSSTNNNNNNNNNSNSNLNDIATSSGSNGYHKSAHTGPESLQSSENNLLHQTASNLSEQQKEQLQQLQTATTRNNTNGNNQHVPNEQFLYCTSSLVPNGYHMMINKSDLIEEEYNFKVSLIRCWRLTSLVTLDSSASAIDHNYHYRQQQQQKPASTVKRKTSLLNSILGNINGGGGGGGGAKQTYCAASAPSPVAAAAASQAGGHVIASGTNGSTLLAAITGSASHLSSSCGRHSSSPLQPHLTAPKNGLVGQQQQQVGDTNGHYDLSFEYLISKDTLKWITISSDQAIFISISLQGVVDELVSRRDERTLSAAGKLIPGAPIIAEAGGVAGPGSGPGSGSVSISGSGSGSGTGSGSGSGLPPTSNAQQQQQQQLLQQPTKGESFTYMFQDGAQKGLSTSNQSLIDKFGTTLGYSPMSPYTFALACQQQQLMRDLGGGGGPSASTSSVAASQRSIWRSQLDQLQQYQHHQQLHQQQQLQLSRHNRVAAFEISHFKKAPSPIINDAFEGVAHDDDM